MGIAFKMLSLVVLMAIIGVGPATAQTSSVTTKAEQQIQAFELELKIAYEKKDRVRLEKLIAEGFTMIHSEGGIETKAEWISQAVEGSLTFQRAENHVVEKQLQLHGENTAVRTEYTLLRVKSDNHDIWLRARDIYSKQNGQWQIISSQSTLMFLGPIIDAKLYEHYVGVYEISPERKFTITQDGTRLIRQVMNRPDVQIFMKSENEFQRNVVTQITFIRDSSGAVTGAIQHSDGKETWRAKKLK